MNYLNNLAIKIKLIALVTFFIVLMFVIGMAGLNGMSWSEKTIGNLYQDSVLQIQQVAVITEVVSDSRSQLLLSLQHDPSSEFATMHDHQLAKHVAQIERDSKKINESWSALRAEMGEEGAQIASIFTQALETYEQNAVQPMIQQLRAGNYVEANRILLVYGNPAFKQVEKIAADLLQRKADGAEAYFSEAQRQYSSALNLIILLLAVATVAGGAIAYLVIKRITYAVGELSGAAEQLAKGDLSARSGYRSEDELGQISLAFNRMGKRFENVIQEISGAASQLSAAATETSTVTAQSNSGIQQQRLETDQVATAMNEMNATVHEVASNASIAADAAKQADDALTDGKRVIAETITTIDNLAQEIGKAASVIHSLEEESETISSVIDVIRGIADQTNLLALNAAIEAARAGEQGRGFAVVADEVRTLASRTQESTQEIENMIGRLQSGSKDAVNVMAMSQEQAKRGVEQTAEAGSSLEVISTAITHINDMNTQIASASEQQSAVAEDINRNIVNISQIAEETAIGAEQTSKASDELARLAEHLQGLVGQFNIRNR